MLVVVPLLVVVGLVTRLGDGTTEGELGDALAVTEDATDGEGPRLQVAATWGVPEAGFLLDGEGPAGLDLVESAPVVVLASAPDDRVAVWLAGQLRAPLVTVPATDPGPSASGSEASTDASSSSVLPAAWATRVVVEVGTVEASVPEDVRRIAVTDTPTPENEPTSEDGETPEDETTATGPPPVDTSPLAAMRNAFATMPEGVDLDPVQKLLDAAPGPSDERTFTALVRPDATAATLVPLVLAGASIEQTTAIDLFAEDAEVVTAAVQDADLPVVQAGAPEDWADVDQDVWGWQREVLAAGTELPGGGYRVFPGDRRYISMYGSPETTSLGILGEQGIEASVERARGLAADYEGLDELMPIPSWEFIATVASGEPQPSEDYSRRVPQDIVREWVDAAGEAGIYVVLDLQSGRTDFLTQAKELEEFLAQPHVGLALDPEWRLEPDELHLVQIGSVDVAEVNAVGEWLAQLTRDNALPEKVLLVHQFTSAMFTGKSEFADRPELAEVVQMDGQGSQPGKLSTWEAIVKPDTPDHVRLGWKNFYDEDPETRSPADTVTLDPTPVFVSYQ